MSDRRIAGIRSKCRIQAAVAFEPRDEVLCVKAPDNNDLTGVQQKGSFRVYFLILPQVGRHESISSERGIKRPIGVVASDCKCIFTITGANGDDPPVWLDNDFSKEVTLKIVRCRIELRQHNSIVTECRIQQAIGVIPKQSELEPTAEKRPVVGIRSAAEQDFTISLDRYRMALIILAHTGDIREGHSVRPKRTVYRAV